MGLRKIFPRHERLRRKRLGINEVMNAKFEIMREGNYLHNSEWRSRWGIWNFAREQEDNERPFELNAWLSLKKFNLKKNTRKQNFLTQQFRSKADRGIRFHSPEDKLSALKGFSPILHSIDIHFTRYSHDTLGAHKEINSISLHLRKSPT